MPQVSRHLTPQGLIKMTASLIPPFLHGIPDFFWQFESSKQTHIRSLYGFQIAAP
jgi:hypothetical protein